ncbi:hypothetical protein [Pedosphaera parvula]|uniref:Fimbrial assembly family protein n=1 Tax=Pedosphaera parvula (strain Ellin514) TaxID=320771 RepID=B9XBV4_PEDPL|nr:hypothetical protein [Pedosphaera parvula]EEF62422.1 hypothetical protein Cflav_PD5057 [Pedosphaera parvula Ellin514]
MPIRINLLAEAQATEDLRRKDPVKRTIWAGIMAVCLVLVFSSSLQVKVMTQNAKLNTLEARLGTRTNEYQQILRDRKKLGETTEKLTALQIMATNRFLYATLLDSLQHTVVDGIHITRIRVDQNYEVTPPVKGDSNKPGKPGKSTERVFLTLDARDSSANPGGDQVNRFKEAISQYSYFKENHLTTNEIRLKNLATPQLDAESGKPFVQFTFECRYPERIH